MHKTYKNPAIRRLRDQQIRFAPRDKKIEQANLAEKLLGELAPGRTYTYEYLCYRITRYRPESYPDLKLEAREASHDLRLFVEDISDAANIPADAAGERVLTVDELTRQFQVSTKTISRWRRQGLVSRRFVFDGRKRVGFLQSSVDRFVERNRDFVRRGAQFSQLNDEEREKIVEGARRLARAGGYPADVTKRLARSMGRSVETIRYTLKQFDRDHPDLAIFPDMNGPLREERKRKIYQQFQRGESAEALAKKFCCTKTSIYRIVGEVRAKRILELPLDYIANEEFAEYGPQRREKVILGPMPSSDEPVRKSRLPSGLPPYLASLYEVPLLTREQEVHLFRRMNYLEYKASRLREGLDPSRPKTALMDLIDALHDEAVAIKTEIISANLRLVVSIAKRLRNPTKDFLELIDDGNKSLIRAVAKFDFARGYRFSTYASRVIMRGLGHQKDRGRGAISLTAEEHLGQHSRELAALLQKLEVPETWKKLDDREKKVIAMRFGLFGENRQTLKQIGERMGISKERVRQLESRALGKLGRQVSQNLPPREAPQNAHESHEATCRETTEAAGVQATAEELDKYCEYAALMKDDNLDPRSLDAWLENYRARTRL